MPEDWIDISTPLHTGMRHWPGDPEVVIERASLFMHPHTGTHMDAPLHFIRDGLTIEELPFPSVIGPARVVDLKHLDTDLLSRGERILIKGATDEGITSKLADALVERAPACLGIDSLSIGDGSVHKTVLGAGIWVIEGLNLAHVEPGVWEMICLPLRIASGDGAPARAIVRRLP